MQREWQNDPYLVPDSPEREDRREEEAKKAAAAKPVVLLRNVTHPYFKNVIAQEADKFLAGKEGKR